MSDEHWMNGAVKHPGVFSAEARRKGMTTHELAEEKKDAPGTEGKRARLALTFEKERPSHPAHAKSSAMQKRLYGGK